VVALGLEEGGAVVAVGDLLVEGIHALSLANLVTEETEESKLEDSGL
jgi:hypothetical protein